MCFQTCCDSPLILNIAYCVSFYDTARARAAERVVRNGTSSAGIAAARGALPRVARFSSARELRVGTMAKNIMATSDLRCTVEPACCSGPAAFCCSDRTLATRARACALNARAFSAFPSSVAGRAASTVSVPAFSGALLRAMRLPFVA